MPLYNLVLLRLSKMKRIIVKHIRKGIHLYTIHSIGIVADKCFETVTKDGTNSILIVLNREKFREYRQIGLKDLKSRLGGRLVLKPKAKRVRFHTIEEESE